MDDGVTGWQAEEIPDSDSLFMRVHRNNLDSSGNPIPGAFRNQPTREDGMSTDWDKYSDATQCRSRARDPENNIVIGMNVGHVRLIPGMTVQHTPNIELQNRAHTDVIGEKNAEARAKFMDCYWHEFES